MHGHLVLDRARILLALGQRGEGLALHLYPAVADGVLPAASRDHPAHLARRTVAREVRALHYDPRHLQVRRSVAWYHAGELHVSSIEWANSSYKISSRCKYE